MEPKQILLTLGPLFTAVTGALAQPVITTQPQDQTNYVGTTATLTVVVTGTEPVAYQWQKVSTGFADLADRTNAALILTNVQTNDAADYRVVMTDAIGTTNSAAAYLFVAMPETLFIAQPAPGLVTLSWHGSMVLLKTGLQSTGGNLECPVWVGVAEPSPVTLPIAPTTQFFRLVALPLADELQTATIEDCRSGDYKACENLVAAYLLTPPLRMNLEMELAAQYGVESGSPCLSAAQHQLLIYVRFLTEGT